MDIVETINEHFSNVAQVLARDIPLVDVNPESWNELIVRFHRKLRVLVLF